MADEKFAVSATPAAAAVTRAAAAPAQPDVPIPPQDPRDTDPAATDPTTSGGQPKTSGAGNGPWNQGQTKGWTYKGGDPNDPNSWTKTDQGDQQGGQGGQNANGSYNSPNQVPQQVQQFIRGLMGLLPPQARRILSPFLRQMMGMGGADTCGGTGYPGGGIADQSGAADQPEAQSGPDTESDPSTPSAPTGQSDPLSGAVAGPNGGFTNVRPETYGTGVGGALSNVTPANPANPWAGNPRIFGNQGQGTGLAGLAANQAVNGGITTGPVSPTLAAQTGAGGPGAPSTQPAQTPGQRIMQRNDAYNAAAGRRNSTGAPTSVLNGARAMASIGGGRAVRNWMHAHGYRVDPKWCGDFAAAAVRQSGGTPPSGYPTASNWRNWGRPTGPQPGAIAVAKRQMYGAGRGRYVPTGQTGSHVTVVESVSPDGRTMTVIGGDQSAMRERVSTQNFDFRIMPGPAQVALQ